MSIAANNMQIKVCAEDQETIHFVRENLFDCLDTKVLSNSLLSMY